MNDRWHDYPGRQEEGEDFAGLHLVAKNHEGRGYRGDRRVSSRQRGPIEFGASNFDRRSHRLFRSPDSDPSGRAAQMIKDRPVTVCYLVLFALTLLILGVLR